MKKLKKKMKTIQRDNPRLFQWIVGGMAGWTITVILMIVWLIKYY